MAASRDVPSDGTIEFSGIRTVRTAEQSHSLLLEALSAASSIRVDCSQLTEADISLVQLILSARKTAAGTGKRLTLAHPAEGILHGVLMRGGFLRADSPAGELGFWLKTEAFDEDHS
jgi:ABC-type transporter Mla MlaB component